jgi:hypothetical protein
MLAWERLLLVLRFAWSDTRESGHESVPPLQILRSPISWIYQCELLQDLKLESFMFSFIFQATLCQFSSKHYWLLSAARGTSKRIIGNWYGRDIPLFYNQVGDSSFSRGNRVSKACAFPSIPKRKVPPIPTTVDYFSYVL